MNIIKSSERMSERELNFVELMGLSNLCKSEDKDRINYLVQLFNSDPSSLERYETCFLINYVAKNRVYCVKDKEYWLYEKYSGEKMILSKDEILSGGYTVEDDLWDYLLNLAYEESLKPRKTVSLEQIISNLEQDGFKILDSKNCLLAFNESRNIVFYASSIEKAIHEYNNKNYCLYQQPRICRDGLHVVSCYLKPENCEEKKTDFPVFYDEIASYLRLYDMANDKDTVFNSSMRRIAQYPELYNAVGTENQKLIDEIVLAEPSEDASQMKLNLQK